MPLVRTIEPAALPLNVAEAREHVRQDLTVDDARLDRNIRAARNLAEIECNRTLVASRYKLTLDAFPGYTISNVAYGHSYALSRQAILLERGPALAVQSIKYLDYSGVQQTLASTEWVADLSDTLGRITPRFGKVWPPSLPQIGAVEVVYDAGDVAALTADAITDVLTIRGGLWRSLTVGDALRLSNSGGALPAPLQPDTDYYVQALPSATSFKLAATSGGAAIDITDVGSGTHYLGVLGDGLVSWMLLRIGGLYENREDSVIVERARMESLPYVDRMLDDYRCILN